MIMNNQMPFFMPMYPNNRIDNNITEKLNILEKRLEKLEERVTYLEKTKMTKLQNNKNNYESFKEGYML